MSCLNSSLEDNVRSIYFPDINGAYSGTLEVGGCSFGLLSAQLKSDYTNQAAHSGWPHSGIEVNNLVATIGKSDFAPNTFYQLNRGVVAIKSHITVSNASFSFIKKQPGYYQKDGGAAIVGVGNWRRHFYNSLYVNTSLGAVQIDNATKGVSTFYSNLVVNNCLMTNMWEGVVSQKCTDSLKTSVTNDSIAATKRGINWFDNDGASRMNAWGNTISVTNSGDTAVYGIDCEEFTTGGGNGHYNITGNNITLSDRGRGILQRNVLKSLVAYNYITQTGINARTTGIDVEGSKNITITCNIINGDTAQINTVGIRTGVSTGVSIVCNNTSKTNTGVYFGGSCGGTDMKGNTMEKNYLGLYLDNVAIIGQQIQKGNKWLFYRGLIGALNIDTTNSLLSRFIVTDTMGQKTNNIELFPILDSMNISNPWFVKQSGSTFSCSSNNQCAGLANIVSDISYERAIAKDSIHTMVYEPESRYQGEQYLYEYLKENPSLATTIDFSSFFANHQNTNISDLYDIERDLITHYIYTPSFINLLRVQDSLTTLIEDSLFYISTQPWDSITFYRLSDTYNNLKMARGNLLENQQTIASGTMLSAYYRNSAVLPRELPESNRVAMNDYYANYYEAEIDTIEDAFNTAFAIANQCPYAGGEAVYQARAYIHAINDSIEFDDDALCLLNGIFRTAGRPALAQKTNQEVLIKPNPAIDLVNISLLNKEEGICSITFMNELGIEVLHQKMNCKDAQINIDVKNLASGIYYIRLTNQSDWNFVKKLIIAR